MILTIRTDKPESEIGLFAVDGEKLAYKTWQAHRELSETIHKTIAELLKSVDKDWSYISGVVYFSGPGSFTGLRIGAAVANALAAAGRIPLSAQNSSDWILDGISALGKGETQVALPIYDSEPKVTKPKK